MSKEPKSFHRRASAVTTKLSRSQSLSDVEGVPQHNITDSEVRSDFDIDFLLNDGWVDRKMKIEISFHSDRCFCGCNTSDIICNSVLGKR
jgi:hypothetical protein